METGRRSVGVGFVEDFLLHKRLAPGVGNQLANDAVNHEHSSRHRGTTCHHAGCRAAPAESVGARAVGVGQPSVRWDLNLSVLIAGVFKS